MISGAKSKNIRKKHANIPVFIPHLGCPNQCVFCDQRFISGTQEFCEADVAKNVEAALETVKKSGKTAEIAFFGGSFTGIERDLMIRLLDLAQSYVDAGDVMGIRMSTRPDYITEEIVDILKNYSISQVELGLQSMSENVLLASKRGHTSADAIRACSKLKSAGISFVGQMMVGLPASTPEDEVKCAEMICDMGADGARIYPTVVFCRTELEDMAKRGEYVPLELGEAVQRSADVLEVFLRRGVPCLRIGLCKSESLHDSGKYFAGPAHAAIGEAVKSEVYRRRVAKALDGADVRGKNAEFTVSKGEVSALVGLSGSNKEFFIKEFGIKKMKFTEDSSMQPFEVKVKVSETIENR